MGLTAAQIRKRQAVTGLALGVACWLVLSGAYLAGLLQPFDLRLLDLRFRLRGERAPDDSVALVGVDDATIRGYGSWPLPRDSYALLITALEEAGARVIGVDLQFPNDRNQDPRSNELLANVSAAHANVVHAIWFYAQRRSDSSAQPNPEAMEALAPHGAVANGQRFAPAGGAAVPFDDLATSAKAFGHITVTVDRDGTIRRIPLFVRYADRVYPTLALVVYGIGRGLVGVPSLRAAPRGLQVRWPNGPHFFAPVDREGSTAIDFAGDGGSFPYAYSMLEVLQWYQGGETKRLREAFSGKTILIGLTSQEEASEDVGPTPFAAATPLLIVHANVLEDLRRGRFLLELPTAAYLAGLAVYGALLGLLVSAFSLPVSAGIVAVATLAMALASQLALTWASMDVPAVLCLALGPAVYAGTASYRYVFLEGRSRRREAEIREGLSVQQQLLPEALIGRRLMSYRIEERIGAGGMGFVYRATDERSGGEVAVKVLPGGLLAGERDRRRFQHEARALSRLHHPHIARLIDSDTQDGHDFIVMEFVRGQSLAKRIRGPLPEAETVSVASQVCEALAEAHRCGVLHRDLKPANVMLTDRSFVKLLDFGLARLVSLGSSGSTLTGSLTEPGHIMGTLPYMAPEGLQGGHVDERTDVYGVGVLLFEMTTGRRPFQEDHPHELMYMILNQPPPRPGVLNAKVSGGLEALTLACLSKLPEKRPAGASVVLQALRGQLTLNPE